MSGKFQFRYWYDPVEDAGKYEVSALGAQPDLGQREEALSRTSDVFRDEYFHHGRVNGTVENTRKLSLRMRKRTPEELEVAAKRQADQVVKYACRRLDMWAIQDDARDDAEFKTVGCP